jgi:hypothetical protein
VECRGHALVRTRRCGGCDGVRFVRRRRAGRSEAQWKLHSSSTWTTIGSFALNDLSLPLNPSGSLSLGSSANNALIDIRLFTDASNGSGGASDGAYIDNVVLSGTAAPVPGPVVGAGLPGLMAACGGLVVLARRRRKLV